MAETSTEKKLTLKLMLDVKTKKLVFAEANKEFVDFIISLLSMPLSSVTKLLLQHEKSMVGCFGALYKSIESLDTQLFVPNVTPISLLKPKPFVTIPLLSFHDCYVTRTYAQNRCSCKGDMDSTAIYSNLITDPSYVNGGTVYIVMDNLEVKPMSIDTLIKSNVKVFDVLEEKQVQVGLQEGVAILKASLETSYVLSTVFLEKIDRLP